MIHHLAARVLLMMGGGVDRAHAQWRVVRTLPANLRRYYWDALAIEVNHALE